MGVQELSLLTAGNQLAQATAKFAAAAAAATTDKVAAAMYQSMAALAANAVLLTAYGLTAANAEFTAIQAAEKAFVDSANTLPPIT